MTTIFTDIFNEIKNDPMNKAFTDKGINPLYYADAEAELLIIGQAPGLIAETTNLYWNDPSGDRLRNWMGVDREVFYHSGKIAILPMDFYFPGKGKSGDLPPRKSFAEKWHPQLIKAMPKIQLTLLVGSYANHAYLHLKSTDKLTEVVENYEHYLPQYFPLIHPSPRNQIWIKKHPWFEEKVVPVLRVKIAEILTEK